MPWKSSKFSILLINFRSSRNGQSILTCYFLMSKLLISYSKMQIKRRNSSMSYTRDTKTIGILANLSETKIYIMLISDQTYSKENTYRD